MNILFTGGSSFTGYWCIRALSEAGHAVRATFTGKAISSYAGVRRERIDALREHCEPEFGCRFGDARFLSVIREAPRWDLLCHHAAEATDYKSEAFDVCGALAANARDLPRVLGVLKERGCRAVLLTGSVFEPDEGRGGEMRAFSPYGLSKGFTWQLFRYRCAREGISLGKFVIPNPFGPLEEERFTSFLVRSWFRGEKPVVRTPDYIRDNIHVGLLAGVYRRFAESVGRAETALSRINPSGYAESQGDFTRRFAAELAGRLGLACEFRFSEQTEFPEPRERVNNEPAADLVPEWSEKDAWDELADYYRRRYRGAA